MKKERYTKDTIPLWYNNKLNPTNKIKREEHKLALNINLNIYRMLKCILKEINTLWRIKHYTLVYRSFAFRMV